MKRIKTSVLFLFFACTLTAQDIARFQFNHISTNNGLSSNYARKIVQDPFGFIWIATQDGLNRYDGVAFVQYNNFSNSPQTISGSDIRDLIVDTANTLLWELNSYGGFDALNYQTGKVEFSFRQALHDSLKGILLSSFLLYNNQLFIGSSKGLYVFDIKSQKLKYQNIQSGQTADTPWISKVWIDKEDRLWFFCNGNGVKVVDCKNWNQIYFTEEKKFISTFFASYIYFFDCAETAGGEMIAATNDGLKCFRIKNNQLFHDENYFPETVKQFYRKDVFVATIDANNYLWIAAENSFLRIDLSGKTAVSVYENNSWDEFEWINSVYSFFTDRDNNIWLGCQQGVLYSKNESSAFAKYSRSADTKFNLKHSYHIFPLSDSVFYCSSTNGFYRIAGKQFNIFPLKQNDIFFYSFKDPQNRIWASARSGTYFLKNDQLSEIQTCYPEFARLGKFTINSHVRLNDSIIILGTESRHGVIIWNHIRKKFSVIDSETRPHKLKEIFINNLFRDQRGNVWILCDNSIGIYDPVMDKLSWLSASDKRSGVNYSIFFDACYLNGRYYIASYGHGVIELDTNYNFRRLISIDEGLTNNGVYKVLPYADSLLFITSNYGLSAFNPANGEIRKYFISDGLHSDVFEERAGATYHNLVFAGGAKGFTKIDMSLSMQDVKKPEFYFSKIVVRQSNARDIDTSNLLLKYYEIGNNWLQTTISFSPLKFVNQYRLRYQYRIREKDSAWIDNKNYNFLSLNGLPPGTYNLEVRVANELGVWSDPKTLTLKFNPKWFETTWFAILIALIVIAVIYGFYRYRLFKIRSEQNHIRQVRESIASDLHDDIGSTLNSIKIFTHLAEQSAGSQNYFELIKQSLKQASEGLRDMIWVLDDDDDSMSELVKRIRYFMQPLANAQGITLDFSVQELPGIKLKKTEKRNLLMIAKEAINNCIKYAHCRNIKVSLVQMRDKKMMIIDDDGSGFDVSTINPGNGLKNIRNRAKQIGYIVEINTGPGTGTCITLKSKSGN